MDEAKRWDAVGAKIRSSLALLEDGNAMEFMTPKDKIEMRQKLVSVMEAKYEAQHNPDDLFTAIEHAEVLLQLLSRSSPDRLQLLERLSYMKMSAYMVTYSVEDVDNSIMYAREAKANINSPDDPLLFRIYGGLGYALSVKYQLGSGNLALLDEAISCARETVRLAPDELLSASNATNLATRLHLRYCRTHQEEDVTESLHILSTNIKTLRPASEQHGAAVFARGEISYALFKNTGSIEDLDEAIKHCDEGAASMSTVEERRMDVLRRLSDLYECKYKITHDLEYMQRSVDTFGKILDNMSPNHPRRVDFISHKLALFKPLLSSTSSLALVQRVTDEAQKLYREVPETHPTRLACGERVALFMCKQYLLSRRVGELKAAIKHAIAHCRECNDETARSKKTIVDISPLLAFSSCLDRVDEKDLQAASRIYDYFYSIFGGVSVNPVNALMEIYRQHSQNLESLCRNQKITDVEGADGTFSDKNLWMGRQRLSKGSPSLGKKQRSNYRDPLTGDRYLALDQTSNRLVLSLETLMRDVLGYGENDPPTLPWAEFAAREARLERETREQEQLLGKRPNPRLCRVCRKLKPIVPERGAFRWNTELALPYGNWNQLRCRSHCVICRLLLSLITLNSNLDLHPRLAIMDPEIQGVQFNIQRLSTGENMLGVEYGLKAVGGLRIVTPENERDALRRITEISGMQDSTIDSAESTSGGLIDLNKVREWLDRCDREHGHACASVWAEERCAAHIQLLMVDVIDDCLVWVSSSVKYFVQSYVWGGLDMPKTLKSNLAERLQKGSLGQDNCNLPQTTKDAIWLVRSLGERYLWVDYLCIVQDDSDHKHRDIGNMDIVFSKGFATIAALHGNNADAGLPGVRPNTRPPQLTEELLISPGSTELEYDPSSGSGTERVILTTTPSPLSLVMDTVTWNWRGWTFQERLLSRRCIYFTSTVAYFQCNRQTISESALEGSAYFLKNPLPDQRLRSFHQHNPLTGLNRIPFVSVDQHLSYIFDVYVEAVEMYTARELTFASDIVSAFSGILAALGEHFGSGFVSALPSAAFDLALLWTPPPRPLTRTPFIQNAKKPYRAGEYFPSWSWTGSFGRAEYRLSSHSGSAPLPVPLVDMFTIHHNGTVRTIRGRRTASTFSQDHYSTTTRAKKAEDLPFTPAGSATDVEFVQHGVAGPDYGPDILQFWAQTVDADLFHFDKNGAPEHLSRREHIHTQGQQAILRLYDKQNNQCGLWYDNKNHRLWRRTEINKGKKDPAKEIRRWEYVAISMSKADKIQGPYRVEGEINIFDEGRFPRTGTDGFVINALCVEWYDEVAARVTVVQIHQRAWEYAKPVRKHIRFI